MTGARRELWLAVLLCLLGSALVLLALGRPWVSFSDPQQLTTAAVRTVVRGSQIAPGARALGFVGLAGVVALAATRRWGRVAVGVLLLAAGVGIVVVLAGVLNDDLAQRGLEAHVRAGAPGPRVVTDLRGTPGWPVAGLVGGVMSALSGLLVAVRGRRWATLSSAHETPAARAEQPAPPGEKAVWDALDRGEDPTGDRP